MNLYRLIALAGLAFLFASLSVRAQTPASPVSVRYKFTPGQRLRYLVMRDPYFADPAGAIETADPRAPYRPPLVRRLIENVQSVAADGTATIQVAISAEPGFEDDDHPMTPVSLTVSVTPRGEVVSPLDSSPAAGFLRAFFRLPTASLIALRGGKQGLAVLARNMPPVVTKRTSPDHDGTLLQTTRSAQADRIVFDLGAGSLLRQTSALTVDVSLIMTNRGRRGVADFGHVVPSLHVVQTMTIERKEDSPQASASLPSSASTRRQSKS